MFVFCTFFSYNYFNKKIKIQIGKKKCAEILIENGAKVNVQDRNGNTPIMLAVLNGK